MKKALIITTISGFVPQFELHNVSILQKMGYEVHYASNFNRPVYEFDGDLFRKRGIVVHHFSIEKSPARLFKNIKAFGELKELLCRERFDLIHCHNPMGGVLGRLAGFLYAPDAVMVYTAHGFHFYRNAPWKNWILFYPVERILSRLTDFLIAINEEDYERAKKFPIRKGGSVWKIPGVGLDAERFSPKWQSRRERKSDLGFPPDCFLILSAGELNRNKNHRAVIRAIHRLNDPDLCYGICGRGVEKERLEKLIARKGLTGRVKLLGYRKDIQEILPAADCFAFPSRREGFGMAAVEAMSCGIGLITSDCRGTREYMEDGVTGIVCGRNCTKSYMDAIRRMKDDPLFREKTGRENRKRAMSFSLKETGNVMRQVYQAAATRQTEIQGWRNECGCVDHGRDGSL